jgi:3-hydroxyisobutyrate dehydrogenase-like beta-hydroxyacid dehydrogenase
MKTIKIIKNILIIIGAIAAYYMVSLQVQYGVTTKVISEMISLFGLQSKRCDKASKQKMHLNDQPLPLQLLVCSIGKS